ncbi:MAG: hypothetical protein ABI091_09275 [Ferruginibacter sp.]
MALITQHTLQPVTAGSACAVFSNLRSETSNEILNKQLKPYWENANQQLWRQ